MSATFTGYQRFVVALLAFIQFTVVVDFMILSPLGAMLLEQLSITTAQFGLVVSAYAFSAAFSGILAAGIADQFDRRKLLLFFYVGFVFGTFLCGMATTYKFLLFARVVTGLFGGVIGSISFAIIADLFPLAMRGRVMGVVQTAFAGSQVLGIPMGLYLANHWGWHAPFRMLVVVCILGGLLIAAKLQPLTLHLTGASKTNPVEHLVRTATRGRYVAGFAATILLATGGFMLMPFGSTFLVQNLGISMAKLPTVYLVTGLTSIFAGPLIGRLSDKVGKYPVFVVGSLIGAVFVSWYTGLKQASLWYVIALNVVLFVAISSRMISASALTSALPDLKDRGAYMAISASLQQLSGGMAAWVAGLIVHQASPTSPIEGYSTLGWVVVAAMLMTVALMFNVQRIVSRGTEPSAVSGQQLKAES